MDIKLGSSNIIFFILINSTFIFTRCKKPCENFHYNFKGTAIFNPETDSVKVGDTIRFSSIIPDQILNENNNQIVDYSGSSNFATDIHINVIRGINSLTGAVDSFNYVQIKGMVQTHQITPSSAKTVFYVEENVAYNLSFGLIALKKGIYAISMVDIQNSKKKCSDAYIMVTLSNADKHQHYLNLIYYPGSPYGDSVPAIEQTHVYCFKVY